jgi:hypothetical protein
VVEGSGLENRRGASHRGFESHPLRQVWALTGDPRGWQSWITDIEDVHVTGDGPLADGSSVSYRWRGRTVNARGSPYVERERMGIQSTEKSYKFHGRSRFATSGSEP